MASRAFTNKHTHNVAQCIFCDLNIAFKEVNSYPSCGGVNDTMSEIRHSYVSCLRLERTLVPRCWRLLSRAPLVVACMIIVRIHTFDFSTVTSWKLAFCMFSHGYIVFFPLPLCPYFFDIALLWYESMFFCGTIIIRINEHFANMG